MRLRLFCKGRPSLWLPPPIFFWSCPKENGPWTVQKKKRYDEQEDRSVLLFVVTGVVRIGAVKINTPRRPCAGPRQTKRCVPAFDGAADGQGGGLDRRISTPARSASLRAAPAFHVGSPMVFAALPCIGGAGSMCFAAVRLSSTAQAAPSEAEDAETEANQIRCPPRLSAQGRYAAAGLFERRMSGAGTTGPPIPAAPIRTTPVLRQSAPDGAFCRPAVFSSTGRGAFSFVKTKENGGRISRETPGVHPGPVPHRSR